MDVDFGDLEIGHHADGNRAYLSPTSANFEWQWASTVHLIPTAYDADGERPW